MTTHSYIFIRASEAISDDLTLVSSVLSEALQVHRLSLPIEYCNPNLTGCSAEGLSNIRRERAEIWLSRFASPDDLCISPTARFLTTDDLGIEQNYCTSVVAVRKAPFRGRYWVLSNSTLGALGLYSKSTLNTLVLTII